MPDKFQIQVNGQARMWRKGGTVAELLHELDLTTERVAVELNLEILDRAAFAGRPLQEGDRVEILSFIGGGANGAVGLSPTPLKSHSVRNHTVRIEGRHGGRSSHHRGS